MLLIDPHALDAAAEALMIAAVTATDERGMKVCVPLPERPPTTADGLLLDLLDRERIRAIALGAVVVLVRGAARLADEVPLSGFGPKE